MVITVDPFCRKCNANDPRDISVADWTQVKQNLSPVPGWKCPRCGCTAAFWYIKRDVYKEEEFINSAERQAIDEQQGVLQAFACTTDKDFPVPPDFDGTVVNPITRIAL